MAPRFVPHRAGRAWAVWHDALGIVDGFEDCGTAAAAAEHAAELNAEAGARAAQEAADADETPAIIDLPRAA